MAVAMIYAPSGGGKTVNSTLVKGKKNLLLCSDNSSLVLKNFERKNLTIEPIEHWLNEDNAGMAQNCLKKQFERATSQGYDNIIIDNVSDIFDLAILEYESSGRKKDMRQAYLETYQDLKRLTRRAIFAKCNVIFTAWHEVVDVPQLNGSVIQRVQPKIPQKILDNMLGLCNIVGYVKSGDKDGKKVWWYQLEGSENIYAKDQLYCRPFCKAEDLFNE